MGSWIGDEECDNVTLDNAEDEFIDFLRLHGRNNCHRVSAASGLGTVVPPSLNADPFMTGEPLFAREVSRPTAVTRRRVSEAREGQPPLRGEQRKTAMLPPELLELLRQDAANRRDHEDDEVVAFLRRQVERCCRELR